MLKRAVVARAGVYTSKSRSRALGEMNSASAASEDARPGAAAESGRGGRVGSRRAVLVVVVVVVACCAAGVSAQTASRRCPVSGSVRYGEYRLSYQRACKPNDALVSRSLLSWPCADFKLPLCPDLVCAGCFPASLVDAATGRKYGPLSLEEERRLAAGTGLLTLGGVPDYSTSSTTNPFLSGGDVLGSLGNVFRAGSLGGFLNSISALTTFMSGYLSVLSGNAMFPLTNFVDGFRAGESASQQWKRPVPGETVGVVSYAEAAATLLKSNFTANYPFFSDYFTGRRVPSWEDHTSHKSAIALLDAGVAAARATGFEPISSIYSTSPRFAFDSEGLTKATWNGFAWLGARDIKYASNGVHGVSVVESYGGEDTLGLLATDSVFGAHLAYNSASRLFEIDLTRLERYAPLAGYAKMGGKVAFRLEGGRLRTASITYAGRTYGAADFANATVRAEFQRNRLVGWRFAEKALIASLLSMTNLVVHVKDLHLEIAAALQAVTVDAFASNVDHPLSRLLQPFTHRSIQATNDNFKLLFEYKAAEFSLAPLSTAEQLRLIADKIREEPLLLSELEMDRFASKRNMPASASASQAQGGFWRWHYRTRTVQGLYEAMIECSLAKNFASTSALEADPLVRKWWAELIRYMPALRRSIAAKDGFASETLTKQSLVNVLKTLFTWVSWVHEDVGHSAAAYVYNPVHTPMAVPADGAGIPLKMVAFNVAAYRMFVFLERAKLLGPAPAHWFSTAAGDQQCFTSFQSQLKALGVSDPAFSECDTKGFYSCVARVETCVSS